MRTIFSLIQRAVARPIVAVAAALAFVAIVLTGSATAHAAALPQSQSQSQSQHASSMPGGGHAVASPITGQPAQNVRPLYSQDIKISIQCATWSGELSWGGLGSILFPAYIDLSGTLKDTCNNGYAQIFLHWDTIDNPKNPLVKQVGANSSAKTPYSTEDDFNTYKDIYIYICSEDTNGYRCSGHEGPA